MNEINFESKSCEKFLNERETVDLCNVIRSTQGNFCTRPIFKYLCFANYE